MGVFTNADDILFYWKSEDGVLARIGAHLPTVSRSTVGAHQEWGGKLDTAWPANKPRHQWVQAKGVWRRGLILEPSRTNEFLNSDTDVGTLSNLTSTANAAAAPNGSLTATRIEEAAVTDRHIAFMSTTTTAGQHYSYSRFFRKGTRRYVRLAMHSGSASEYSVILDFDTGNVSTGGTGTDISLLGAGAEPVGNGWYRVWIAATTNVALTLYPLFAPSNAVDHTVNYSYAGSTSENLFTWGHQLEVGHKYPTSYIPTTTAAVTRGADSFYWSTAPDPQPMAVYCRFVESGTAYGGTTNRVLQLGTSGVTGAVLDLARANNSSNVYMLDHWNGTSVINSILSASPPIGSLVELVGLLFTDGSVKVIQSINGAAVTSSTRSVANTIQSKWSTNTLFFNASDTSASTPGAGGHTDVRIAKYNSALQALTDQQLMDEMRALEVDQYANLIS